MTDLRPRITKPAGTMPQRLAAAAEATNRITTHNGQHDPTRCDDCAAIRYARGDNL